MFHLPELLLQTLPPLPPAAMLPPGILARGKRQIVTAKTWLAPRKDKDGHLTGIYYINEGVARTSRLAVGGESKTLHILGKGYFIFESYFISGNYPQIACEAIKDMEAFLFDRTVANELMDTETFFTQRLMFSMGMKMQLMGHDLVSMAYERPEIRIKLCVASLAVAVGKKHGNGIEVQITQNEIAGLLGMHRVSVTRILGKLAERKILSINRGCMFLLPEFFMDEDIKSWNSQGYALPCASG